MTALSKEQNKGCFSQQILPSAVALKCNSTHFNWHLNHVQF